MQYFLYAIKNNARSHFVASSFDWIIEKFCSGNAFCSVPVLLGMGLKGPACVLGGILRTRRKQPNHYFEFDHGDDDGYSSSCSLVLQQLGFSASETLTISLWRL